MLTNCNTKRQHIFTRMAIVALAATAFLAATACGIAIDIQDFESPGVWHTAPIGIREAMGEHPLYCAREYGTGGPLNVPSVPFEELDGGLEITSDTALQGTASGLWRKRAKFPTVATHQVPRDWSAWRNLEIAIHSEHATGETLTVGVLSDSDETPWRDYYTTEIVVDWTGWRNVRLPLAKFEPYEKPAGWNKVDGLYLFARARGRLPNPHNPLHLDRMRLSGKADPAEPGDVCEKEKPADDFVYQAPRTEDPPPLNHAFPEVARTEPFKAGEDYIVHQPYYRDERALYDYYPRFRPGRVSVAPDGKRYVHGGEIIQWADDEAHWHTSDLKPVLVAWAKERGWTGLYNPCYIMRGETAIRFDAEGDAYLLQHAEEVDKEGVRHDWQTRCMLLLHSRDGMKTWQVYRLPDGARSARFEKIDGCNTDALKRPPVILYCDHKYFGGADQANYITIPEKLADGALRIPEGVAYAPSAVGPASHSGDGNNAVTVGDKVYLVYGWMPDQSGMFKTVKEYNAPREDYMKKVRAREADPGEWEWSKERARKDGMPPIPEGHPMLDMRWTKRSHQDFTGWSRNGVPTYALVYDIETRTVSDPVYIGSGGLSLDNHNGPSIAVDPNGILHVVINGHIDPVVYTHTTAPLDTSSWSKPVYVGNASSYLSYASLNCDSDGNLLMTNRSDTNTYNHRLAMYRKPAGKDWQAEKTLLAPFNSNYHVWWHRMSWDPVRGHYYFTYKYDPGILVSHDISAFHRFYFPFLEKDRYGKDGSPEPGKYGKIFHERKHRGVVTLMSDDGGESWRFATTPDLK